MAKQGARPTAGREKIETYSREVEVSAAAVAGSRHTSRRERDKLVTVVLGDAREIADYIVRRAEAKKS